MALGLNTSGTYLGVTAAGVIGALATPTVGAHYLGYVGAGIVVVAVVLACPHRGRRR